VHEKPLIGGYLSRVSGGRVTELRRIDMLDALIVLSEGGVIPQQRQVALMAGGPTFVRDANLGFVIIDRKRSSPALIEFAKRAFRLRLIEVDGVFELYEPLDQRGDSTPVIHSEAPRLVAVIPSRTTHLVPGATH
jgi:hypothetical protein